MAYDCQGYVTKYGVKCTDGLTISQGAFAGQNGARVPLVWMHNHDDVEQVLGYCDLESRNDGMYGKVSFNDTEAGLAAQAIVKHGDVTGFSIHAGHLKRGMPKTTISHGVIKEVSLVLAGANPEARIDALNMSHSDDGEESFDDANIFTTPKTLELYHEDEDNDMNINELEHEDSEETIEDIIETMNEKQKNVLYALIGQVLEDNGEASQSDEDADGISQEDSDGETIADIIETMNEKQKNVLYALIGQALEEKSEVEHNDNEEDISNMKKNVFASDKEVNTMTQSDMQKLFRDAKRLGSLKAAVLEHSDMDDAEALEETISQADYGVENVDYLFPEARNFTNEPIFIQRDMDWVKQVMGKVHKTPFSRVKSLFADITEDDARAKGYIKGKLKKEEVFSLLKRTTAPTTIYKKQKIDRDDLLDITDFNFVAWLKGEMRMMLNEELARAILVGDGRASSSDDKINEQCIRPVWTDADLYTVKCAVEKGADDSEHAKNFIKAVRKNRKLYKGTGNPDLYTTEDMLTEMLMLEDTTGRVIYDTVEKLRTALRVNSIVTVEVLSGLQRTGTTGTESGKKFDLDGILVNLADYNVGADKGGEIAMFDDFDIDYNQQKYLMETRCSGALVRPYAALAFEVENAG